MRKRLFAPDTWASESHASTVKSFHAEPIIQGEGVAATDITAKLRLLEQLAVRLGVEIRFEPMREDRGTAAGGLCRLRGQSIIIIDSGAPPAEQVGVLLDALSKLDTESVFVPPLIRRELARRRDGR